MISLFIFLKVFIPVFCVVICPGPCMLSYGNIAMNYGYKKGYAGVFGCYTVELLYWLIGVFALGTARSLLPNTLVMCLSIFSGLFLLYIAYGIYKTDLSKIENVKNSSSLAIYVKFLLLTLSNPQAVFGYAAIYVAIENIKDYAVIILFASALVFIIAHSIIVLVNCTLGKTMLKCKKGEKMLKGINVISAICIAGYSVIEILIPMMRAFFKVF